jgi:hypothetical protein
VLRQNCATRQIFAANSPAPKGAPTNFPRLILGKLALMLRTGASEFFYLGQWALRCTFPQPKDSDQWLFFQMRQCLTRQ